METFFSVLILLIVVVAFANEFFQQKLGVSPMPTMPGVRRAMLAQIPAGTVGKIVELGAGGGTVSFAAAKAFPQCRVVGVEYSVFPFLIARMRQLFLPNLLFIRRNFFDISFGDAEVVLCYLTNPLMAELKEKFERELPSGAVIISSTFFIPGWEPEKTVDLEGWWKTRIFVYRKA
ncbi:MAG: SAM-dependent methyltransferase [Pseudomonadota bacterium]